MIMHRLMIIALKLGNMANKDKKNKTSYTSKRQKGNKNAETWTEKETEIFFNKSLELSKRNDIYFIGTIAKELETYRQVYDYLVQKFPVFNSIKKDIDSNIENNLFLAGLTDKDISTPLAIFGLKNSHNWKDKTEVVSNVTTNQDTIKVIVQSEAEAKEIKEMLNK